MSLDPLTAIAQHCGTLSWVAAAACVGATVLGGLRWLRVAQREHYLADSASRFAIRWWGSRVENVAGVVLGLAGLVLSARWPLFALVPAAVVAAGPIGMSLRGRTSRLEWTRRLRTLAIAWAVLQCAVVAVGVLSGFAAAVCAAGALAVPALVDLACTATAPLENKLGARYVRQATERLRRVRPKVVAITGSYGKTSTKGYVDHLVSGSLAVVSSPASFNNKLGLARAVNDLLADSTDVLVAEMGTYARGEISELCSWMTPDIAVITAIGPVHLERFGTEDAIVEAKAEILERAPCCVLMVDDPRLATLADNSAAGGKKVWRVSGRPDANSDVSVCEVSETAHDSVVSLRVRGIDVPLGSTKLSSSARPQNLACAVAVALELGVNEQQIAARIGSLPVAPHRLESQSARGGFVVLDDTYNSNPSGAQVALAALATAVQHEHRGVVVTPGMVELGSSQSEQNARFAESVAEMEAALVVVGRTNRKALVDGFRSRSADSSSLVVVDHRAQAVDWVRAHLEPGDAVLYENDLPDHYP